MRNGFRYKSISNDCSYCWCIWILFALCFYALSTSFYICYQQNIKCSNLSFKMSTNAVDSIFKIAQCMICTFLYVANSYFLVSIACSCSSAWVICIYVYGEMYVNVCNEYNVLLCSGMLLYKMIALWFWSILEEINAVQGNEKSTG